MWNCRCKWNLVYYTKEKDGSVKDMRARDYSTGCNVISEMDKMQSSNEQPKYPVSTKQNVKKRRKIR